VDHAHFPLDRFRRETARGMTKRNQITRIARAAVLLFILSSLLSATETRSSSPAPSGFEGIITVAPAHPGPTREGVENSAPLPHATFIVSTEKAEVASFITDDRGRFRVSLGPGHYKVTLKEPRVRHCGPFEVDVAAGHVTAVEWQGDTGMR
jgi:hypothetical protein